MFRPISRSRPASPPLPRFQPSMCAAISPFGLLNPGAVKANTILTKSSLHHIYIECYDECVYNDLPQYLVRIRDMRLYSRAELWKLFHPILGNTPISPKEAEVVVKSAGEQQLRIVYKEHIKRHFKYAIFSHRWGDDEPKFRDVPSIIHRKVYTPAGRGYEKLWRFCAKAKEYGCEFAWSDTCCINKESSSELEEAIRSMYQWYKNAFICIVHLAESSSVTDFAKEPWFTRGWTLQELLAPQRLRMYGRNWMPVCPLAEEARGDDKDFSFPNDKLSDFMVNFISKITHIHPIDIRKFDSTSPYPIIATKMRWASERKTTRVEDTAYSLSGIFDITMSIAYGEGDKAFQRLLEAIAQRSGDPSFFAWAGPCSRYSLSLPHSPASYRVAVSKPYCDHDYAIQKRGIQLKLLVIPVQVIQSKDHYVLKPVNSLFKRNLTVIGQFIHSPEGRLEPNASYAVGVVDFQFDHKRRDVGHLLPGKHHFCVFMRIAWGKVGSGQGVTCRRIDTKGIMPLVECKSNYSARLEATVLEHTRFVFV